MPVNFSQYIVNPWEGVEKADRMNLQRNALMQEQRNADRRNMLAERELGMREQDSNMKLIGTQASVFSKAFKGAKDDASYQNLLGWMDQIGQSELGQSKFFQNIRSKMPKEYNPQAHEQAIQFMDSLVKDPSGGSIPGSIQEFTFAKSQGYEGGYQDWMNERKGSSQPNSVKEYEYAKENGYNGTYSDFIKQSGSGGQSQYNMPIPTNQGWVSFPTRGGDPQLITGPNNQPYLPVAADTTLAGQKTGAEQMYKDLVEKRNTAMEAKSGLTNLKAAKELLNSGIITGTGAEYLTSFGNLLSSRLGVNYYKDPVANTQAFAAIMGGQTARIIKQFGAGTGLSDADREYAEKMAGGSIKVSKESIQKIMDINERAYNNTIRTYNDLAKQAQGQPGAENLPYALPIEMDSDKQQTAPQSAIDHLKKNPALKDQFKEKYGYLPEGF